MKVLVQSVDDVDVLETYFGEDSASRPLDSLGAMHGTVVFRGVLSNLPNDGDVVVFSGTEYNVVVRIFDIANDEVEIIVHERHYDDDGSKS